jgi:hypothetical protein
MRMMEVAGLREVFVRAFRYYCLAFFILSSPTTFVPIVSQRETRCCAGKDITGGAGCQRFVRAIFQKRKGTKCGEGY